METVASLLNSSDARYYTESEISVFTVVDIEFYNMILNRVRRSPNMYAGIVYEKRICYGHGPGITVRARTSSSEPICPVSFAERSRYEYEYDVKKTVVPRRRYAIPVWCDDHVAFVNASSRISYEYGIDGTTFAEYTDTAPNDITGEGRKQLITDRIVISANRTPERATRFAISKKCKFSGNGIFRQPDVPVYVLEYEIEYTDGRCARNKLNVNAACHEYVELCKKTLSMSKDDVYNMTRSGLVNCLPENDLFLSIFNTFKRHFVPASLPDRVGARERAYVCPKWDGIRAIGLWRGGSLMLYNCQFGFKYFPTVPRIFTPDVICQVEYFTDTDTFIVTEIYACVNIEMETDFVYFTRKHGNACRFGEGLYNGSNTSVQLQDNRRHIIIDVDAVDSISTTEHLHSFYPEMFTFHRRIIEWPVDESYVIRKFASDDRTDGAIIKIISAYRQPVYYKLKTSQTVELLYSPDIGQYTSADGTGYNNVIVTGVDAADDFDFKYHKNLCDVSNVSCTMEFYILKPECKLKFKCARYDKIEPDSDDKIKKLFDM